MGLAFCQLERDRQATGIDQRMDFGGQTAYERPMQRDLMHANTRGVESCFEEFPCSGHDCRDTSDSCAGMLPVNGRSFATSLGSSLIRL
jgi:hypothetical protein